MGYYCTVPQCTSLAGKTKGVKFHRFPRDAALAHEWNVILKRGKPYTKYSKVCSLHFKKSDYNINTMGHWKTLNKDAVPSLNLPKLHPDGTVMVIRKARSCRSLKDKRIEGDVKQEVIDAYDYREEGDRSIWMEQSGQCGQSGQSGASSTHSSPNAEHAESTKYRISHKETLPHALPNKEKVCKIDAIIQTDTKIDEIPESCSKTDPLSSSSSFADNSDIIYPKDLSKDTNGSLSSSVEGEAEYKSGEEPCERGADLLPRTLDEFNKPAATVAADTDTDSYSKAGAYKEKYEYDKSPVSASASASGHDAYDDGAADMDAETNIDADADNDADADADRYKGVHDTFGRLYDKDAYRPASYAPDFNFAYHNAADILRNQQHNLQVLQQQQQQQQQQPQPQPPRGVEYYEDRVKQELVSEGYDTGAGGGEELQQELYAHQRLQHHHDHHHQQHHHHHHHHHQQQQQQQRLFDMHHHDHDHDHELDLDPNLYRNRIKTEPDLLTGCETGGGGGGGAGLPGYFSNGQNGFYEQGVGGVGGGGGGAGAGAGYGRQPGAELLIAKQNALAAHTQLWQNTMKRPFFYGEGQTALAPPGFLHPRYEDLSRLLNQ